ncbi:ubiquitin-like protein [Pseudomonas sp. Marseille-QA0332]
MKINVRTLIGQVLELDVQADDTVAMVKKNLVEKTGIPQEQQSLRLGSQELDDDQTLKHYEIEEDALLHLVLKME